MPSYILCGPPVGGSRAAQDSEKVGLDPGINYQGVHLVGSSDYEQNVRYRHLFRRMFWLFKTFAHVDGLLICRPGHSSLYLFKAIVDSNQPYDPEKSK